MEWTIRLEVKTGQGEGESLDLAIMVLSGICSPPVLVGARREASTKRLTRPWGV